MATSIFPGQYNLVLIINQAYTHSNKTEKYEYITGTLQNTYKDKVYLLAENLKNVTLKYKLQFLTPEKFVISESDTWTDIGSDVNAAIIDITDKLDKKYLLYKIIVEVSLKDGALDPQKPKQKINKNIKLYVLPN